MAGVGLKDSHFKQIGINHGHQWLPWFLHIKTWKVVAYGVGVGESRWPIFSNSIRFFGIILLMKDGYIVDAPPYP